MFLERGLVVLKFKELGKGLRMHQLSAFHVKAFNKGYDFSSLILQSTWPPFSNNLKSEIMMEHYNFSEPLLGTISHCWCRRLFSYFHQWTLAPQVSGIKNTEQLSLSTIFTIKMMGCVQFDYQAKIPFSSRLQSKSNAISVAYKMMLCKWQWNIL